MGEFGVAVLMMIATKNGARKLRMAFRTVPINPKTASLPHLICSRQTTSVSLPNPKQGQSSDCHAHHVNRLIWSLNISM